MLILATALLCLWLGAAGGYLAACIVSHRKLPTLLEEHRLKLRESDEAFEEAEFMARRREAINAGRSRLPRADAGPPARISRVNLRPKGRKGTQRY